MMSARSVVINFHNSTFRTLSRGALSIDHGVFITRPPATIAPGARVHWQSDSNGVLTGTAGSVTYNFTGDLSGLENLPKPLRLTLHWVNPFAGSNSYEHTEPGFFRIRQRGGDGDNAVAEFTLDQIIDQSSSGGPL